MNNSAKFGWSYPAGAASDPYAPYNQKDILNNSDFEEQFKDYNSLFELYKSVYKYTDCGPSLGVHVYIEQPDNGEFGPEQGSSESPYKTFYCDDLKKLGSFKDMNRLGILILELSVSSIVEGLDQGTQTYAIEWSPAETEPPKLYEQFWQAIDDCNKEATDIWNDTHGCPNCFDYPESELRPIDPECKKCNGEGTII